MAYSISPVLQGQALDNQGRPLSGGKVFTYVGGSFSTLATSYANYNGSTQNANPVVLDASGRIPPIFLETETYYNLVLTDSSGTIVLQRFENISIGQPA